MLNFQGRSCHRDSSYDDDAYFDPEERTPRERPSLKMFVRIIREQVTLYIIDLFVCAHVLHVSSNSYRMLT